MRRNIAGQKIGAQMVNATTGAAFTAAVTVYVTKDAGTQAQGTVGSGACTHEGNGYHTYAPSQTETDGDVVAFTFVGTGAVPATVQVETQVNTILADASTGWQVVYDLMNNMSGADATLSDATKRDIADKMLARSIFGGADGGKSVSKALAMSGAKWAISGSTLTVYASDGTTPLWTGTITKDANGAIVAVTPA